MKEQGLPEHQETTLQRSLAKRYRTDHPKSLIPDPTHTFIPHADCFAPNFHLPLSFAGRDSESQGKGISSKKKTLPGRCEHIRNPYVFPRNLQAVNPDTCIVPTTKKLVLLDLQPHSPRLQRQIKLS